VTDLKGALEKHAKWRRGEDGGVRANLSGADLSGANLRWADLSGAILRWADLSKADLSKADFSGATLRGAILRRAILNGANLRGADLSKADFSGATLRGAILRWADLSGASFSWADLSGAIFSGADLSEAIFSGANLSGADLNGANLRGAGLPAPTMVLLAYWGDLPNELCQRAMAYDAACHPDPEAFTLWAETGTCPYSGTKFERACFFNESRKLWDPTVPAPRPWDLMVDLIRAKCADSDYHDPKEGCGS